MTARCIAFLSTAAFLLLASMPGSAVAASKGGSLCNAAGKVEVMAQPLDIDCAGGAEQERQALATARSRYQNQGLDWQTRAFIDARIDRRIKQLNREIRNNRS